MIAVAADDVISGHGGIVLVAGMPRGAEAGQVFNRR